MFKLLKLLPPHGWRVVGWELGIVTLGVLIALAAQQLVERVNSKERAAAALIRIKGELENNQGNELERIAIRTCLTDRLRDLGTGIARGRTHWPLRPEVTYPGLPKRAFAMMYHAPARVWPTDAYDEALAQGDLKDVTRERRSDLATVYTQIKLVRELNDEEQRLRATLAPLQFNPTLPSAERNALIVTIARLDQINGLIVLISRQALDRYRELGFRIEARDLAELRRTHFWEKPSRSTAAALVVASMHALSRRLSQLCRNSPQAAWRLGHSPPVRFRAIASAFHPFRPLPASTQTYLSASPTLRTLNPGR